MTKEAFNYRVDNSIAELFEQLCERLGPPKYKVLEAAIEVFAALPKEAQYILKSQNDADRKIILARLRELNLKSQKNKRA